MHIWGFGALLKGTCGVLLKPSILSFLPLASSSPLENSPVMLRSSQAPPEGDARVCGGVGMSVLRAAAHGWKLSADAPCGSGIIEMRKTLQPGTTQRSAILA